MSDRVEDPVEILIPGESIIPSNPEQPVSTIVVQPAAIGSQVVHPINPELNKWLPSRAVLHWLTPFVRLASRHPLQNEDLFDPHPRFSASVLGKLLAARTKNLRRESSPPIPTPSIERPSMVHLASATSTVNGSTESLADDSTRRRNAWNEDKNDKFVQPTGFIDAQLKKKFRRELIYSAWTLFKSDWIASGIAHVVGAVSSVLSPLILENIISTLQDASAPTYQGYLLCLALLALQMLQSVCTCYYSKKDAELAIALRSLFIGAVYRKSLRLSAVARQEYSNGRIVNLLSTDATVFEFFGLTLHDAWVVPLQILCTSALIIYYLRFAGLAGIGLMILCSIVQSFMMRLIAKYESASLKQTDLRIKQISEMLNGIKIIKLFAWEESFLKRIGSVRSLELKSLTKVTVTSALFYGFSYVVPSLVAVATFIVYQVALNQPLSADIVFPALALVNLLRVPLMSVPEIAGYAIEARVALDRLSRFLAAPEMDDVGKLLHNKERGGPFAVKLSNADFEWEKWSGDNSLSAITLEIPHNSLCAVIGPVGSGKSSLLLGLLGEMRHIRGGMHVTRPIAYSPQQAWLLNATLRDNILFGSPFDKSRYNAVIKAAALVRDLEQLPRGDMTEVGERGVALSGGQAARVNIARAMYSNAKLLLLDDPLAAVDAHVGQQLFSDGIRKYCADRTRILVTHQLGVLSNVDYIVYMENCQIKEKGTYHELMERNGRVAALVREHANQSVEASGEELEVSNLAIAVTVPQAKASPSPVTRARPVSPAAPKQPTTVGGNILIEEERETGAVKLQLYIIYMRAAGGFLLWLGVISVVFFIQMDKVVTDLWLVWWSTEKFDAGKGVYVGVYAGLGLVQALSAATLALLTTAASLRASNVLHSNALKRLMYAPMSFFDGTPAGRILSRFSRDVAEIDRWLALTIRSLMNLWGSVIASIGLIGYAVPVIFVVFAPLLPIYYFVQGLYRNAARELKRLESLARSPLFGHFSESLNGLPTLRAYSATSRFVTRADTFLDNANRPSLIKYYVNAWVALRMEILCGFVCFMVATLGLAFRISPSLLGLALSYTLSLTSALNSAMNVFANTESRMNCVERINYYATAIPMEPQSVADVPRNSVEPEPTRTNKVVPTRTKPNLPRLQIPRPKWPSLGAIEFINYSLRYNPDNPPVLRNITLSIGMKEKVGIVGRTGAGKSSIIAGLYRLAEASSGKITIDGVDISTVTLKQLRRSLSIIPQAPILFEGTIRSNLDPTGFHPDQHLWKILERCRLKSFVASMPRKLDGQITENGENLSVGQRQLLCLGRAMLMSPKILIIDEATANVDYETDAMIQQVLRTHLRQCTILTIAHRLSTIMDYDKILVLDHGRVAEFDSPPNLLANPESEFSKLAEETMGDKAESLKSLATEGGSSSWGDKLDLNE
ncbi:uncharacterized protein SPPG_05475 [Spizellomyces punctatus DAOM BR117]|uniref:P-loop containing nucleoside triphosphate hydrolase protein n=1 Tax=Spizellomyces punctatus (strain DAOM BR117) TaxID=645134 RepID=A0A0L0HE20_SPIPD|nr:uncharacterized protein SPPG_05475 [Spizellomyces punctatus DAOM BR117]KNC99219.1 hypothetical protein SPPG_05475 [Spizellomyces punctatus DAOM BR117]|eukprot:XP_016607259.1 hypothetical protein SPPG_05475 [Spizellomyces punctatus DAOM BR117]